MEGKVTLDRIIAFLRVYLTFACCWPLPSNATKPQRLVRSAFLCFCLTNSIVFATAAIWTLYKHSDDVLLVMKLGCQLSAIVQIPLQMLLFAMQNKRLQVRFFVYVQLIEKLCSITYQNLCILLLRLVETVCICKIKRFI